MKNLVLSFLVGGLACALLAPPVEAEEREWTRAADGKKIRAEFVGLEEEGRIRIRMANGQVYDVPLASLSAADREFVQSTLASAEDMEEEAGSGEKTEVPEGEVTVTLTGLAIFCRKCTDRIEGMVESEDFKIDPGVELSASRGGGTVTIEAPTGKAAQGAVRALQSAGYHGESDHPAIRMSELKEDDFTSDTMVVRDAAVICSGGVRAFEDAVESVDGVEEVDAKAGSTRIKVGGEGFKTYEVMKALREAGFGGRFQ